MANYPFATIEPNIGIVPVPDPRLSILADVVKSSDGLQNLPPIVPATVQFVDIAGLVKGAAEGEGLGNKFLSHIREVSIIAHVVRAFEDADIIKEGSVDPKSDYRIIETELMLADLQSVQNMQNRIRRDASVDEKSTLEKLTKALSDGVPAQDTSLTEKEAVIARQWFLLSAKKELIVLNVSEEDYTKENIELIVSKYTSILVIPEEKMVVICAKIEAELAELSEEEQKEYLKDLGVSESGLERLIKKAYQTLGLISFLTAGEKEVRAWTIRLGETSLMASGTIHTDFMQKFIKAEVVSFDDFVQNNGWKGSREKGKARFEGKDYIMKDGDVVEFKIGA